MTKVKLSIVEISKEDKKIKKLKEDRSRLISENVRLREENNKYIGGMINYAPKWKVQELEIENRHLTLEVMEARIQIKKLKVEVIHSPVFGFKLGGYVVRISRM